MGTKESQEITATKPTKIATSFMRNPDKMFYSLMHQINEETLRACFDKLSGKKAVGTDGIDKKQYGVNLQRNLEELVARMKRMAYRPGPVRQVLIPKEGKPGATRTLGISNLEDKLVQVKVHEILESIYDPIFLDCSYGFRPNKGCHDAVKALHQYLFDKEVETVLDIDLTNYFSNIDQSLLKEFLGLKIKDTRFLRYISRMLKAGILADEELTISEECVTQGSCCSPILANIYAHYVIDTWFDGVAMSGKHGPMKMFRYGDDVVICFRSERDAAEIKEALVKRLADFRLTLNESKTKLVKFSKKRYSRGLKQDAFNFLGFTFYLGKAKKGFIMPKLKTTGSRLRSKLKKVNEWARNIRNKTSLRDIWKIFCAKLRGHIQYYGVSFNSKAIRIFRDECVRIMFKWLNRRSQRKSFNWEQFGRFMEAYPPPEAKVIYQLF